MANQKINITNYIKSQLEDKSANYSERKNKKIECLEEIGAAISSAESREWTKYSNYKYLVSKMSDSALTELKDAINRVQFQRKSFTKFITSSREEAAKEETELRSVGYFTYGEYGGDYGYFQHKKKLTEQQVEWFNEHIECCYYHGQPCWVWQKEESNYWDENCECRLGRDFSSLIIFELDEEEEKRLGVWKQDRKWSLNGYGNINIEYYYSLEQLKKDALDECDHKLKKNIKECPVCEKILTYDGIKSFDQGNITIKSINGLDDA